VNQTTRILHASGISISDFKSNSPYMTIAMRMFSTRPNRNGEGVTERFIDSIIANRERHIGLPLCADTTRLRARDYAN